MGYQREMEPDPHNNLPLQLTSFVGRGREVAELQKLLEGGTRLLTLAGTGGSGKTRLALAVAQEVVEDFEDGVWWVELAPVSEPELVPQAVAQALMIREEPGRSLVETLARDLASTEMLLVLDNCEHLIEACASLADSLLRSCPDLKILATSRETLGVAGEIRWNVPPLASPDLRSLPRIEELEGYESVRLFVERARFRRSDFALDPENAPSVAEICRRLDGIPLAIELAAARVGSLSVDQISSRLEHALRLLSVKDRTAPERQRTLRGALDWGYGLLDEEERGLFGRLSVFAGGFTLEAAEAVGPAGDTGDNEVLDVLSRLVEKSIVLVEEEAESRYSLLEPVKRYGQEKLEESGEAETTRERHARYYLSLAEEAEPELAGARQGAWLERLEAEHGNLRAALGWSLGGGDDELGSRLAGALGEFWYMLGHLSEGRRWLQAALERADVPLASTRARVLARAGYIAWEQGDYEQSMALSEESLALFRKVEDEAGIATALYTQAWAALFGNDVERASALSEEAVRLRREIDDTTGAVRALLIVGLVALTRQEYERAVALHEESLASARKLGDDFAIILSLSIGAMALLGLGDTRRAGALCEEGLQLSWQLKMMHLGAAYLHVSASLAGARGEPVRAARLWGAAEVLRKTIGAVLSPVEHTWYDAYIAAARSQLANEAAWDTAWSEGRAMTPQETIEYALQSPQENPASPTSPDPKDLSAREIEVLKLVAQGLTDPQVAERLYLSPRTVGHHLTSVYRKLGVPSRAAAAREATERGLI